MRARRNRWLPFVAPAAGGLAAYASLPGVGLAPAAWVALAPLGAFLVLDAGRRRAFAGGLVFGIAQYFPLLIWIPPVLVRFGGIAPPLAWALYAGMVVFLALFPAVASLAARYVIEGLGPRGVLALPFIWVAMELARAHVGFGGFPWLQIGYSQTEWLRLIQIADTTGVYGVTFLVAWINAAVVDALARRRGRWGRLAPLGAGLVMVVGALAYGTAALGRWSAMPADRRAALLQGDVTFEDPRAIQEWKFGQGYLEMARALGGEGIDLALLPESPAPLDYASDAGYREVLRALAARFTLGIIFNNTRVEGRGRDAAYYNSAFFLSRAGRELGAYDKVHLVPFGEYVPLRRLFFFAESITRDVSDFAQGTRLENLPVDGRPVSAIICFESIFPHLVRGLVAGGGTVIVNLTNDGWYGRSAAPHHHLAMARWRAVENRRYLLRAANSGISAVVTPAGAIEGATGLFRREVSVVRFAFLSHRTPYTAAGDLFAAACAMISVVFSALAARRRGRATSET